MNTWHFQPFQAKQEFTSGAQDCSLSIININKLASSVRGTNEHAQENSNLQLFLYLQNGYWLLACFSAVL